MWLKYFIDYNYYVFITLIDFIINFCAQQVNSQSLCPVITASHRI